MQNTDFQTTQIIEEEEIEDSILVELDNNETTETVALEIMEAKERKDKQKLRVLRAKERQLLLKEVETLRSKAKKLNKENKDEVKIDEDIKI